MTSDPVARYFANRVAQRERQGRLRPMSSGELIDASIGVFQSVGRELLLASLPAALLILAAVGSLTVYVLPEFLGADGTKNFRQQLESAAGSMAITILAGIPLVLIGCSYISALAARTVNDHVVGNAPNIKLAQQEAMRVTPRLVLVVFRIALIASIGIVIAGVIMLGGGALTSKSADDDIAGSAFILCGFFGSFFGLLWFLWSVGAHAICPQIAVLEPGKLGMVLKRSRELLRPHVPHGSGQGPIWAIYGIVFVLFIAIWAGTVGGLGLIGTRAMLEDALRGSGVAQIALTMHDLLPPFLAVWTLIPFASVAISMVYFDRRIRLEGFDIEMLARVAGRTNREVRFEI